MGQFLGPLQSPNKLGAWTVGACYRQTDSPASGPRSAHWGYGAGSTVVVGGTPHQRRGCDSKWPLCPDTESPLSRELRDRAGFCRCLRPMGTVGRSGDIAFRGFLTRHEDRGSKPRAAFPTSLLGVRECGAHVLSQVPPAKPVVQRTSFLVEVGSQEPRARHGSGLARHRCPALPEDALEFSNSRILGFLSSFSYEMTFCRRDISSS